MGYFDRHVAVCPGDVTRHVAHAGSVLDVGCGTGWLADHVRGHVGLDASPEAVAEAVRLGRDVRVWRAPDPLPVADASFQAVVVKDVLEHLDDPVAVVRELHRVAAPGGLVLATAPDAQRWAWDDYTHRRPFTRRSLRHLFEDHGFAVEGAGYECLVPGTATVCRLVPSGRRPAPLRVLARLGAKRNVWVLARRP